MNFTRVLPQRKNSHNFNAFGESKQIVLRLQVGGNGFSFAGELNAAAIVYPPFCPLTANGFASIIQSRVRSMNSVSWKSPSDAKNASTLLGGSRRVA